MRCSMRSSGGTNLALEAQERGVSGSSSARSKGVTKYYSERIAVNGEAGDRYTPGSRQREEGGGRKKAVEKDATLQDDLESLLDPKGDPMSVLKWTSKSVAHLKQTLQQMGHEVADTTIRRLLRARGYSLRATKKNIEGNIASRPRCTV